MIITSPMEFKVGKTYTFDDLQIPFEHVGKKIYKYTFLVLRITSEQEFMDFVKKEYPEYDVMPLEYFYQISMD